MQLQPKYQYGEVTKDDIESLRREAGEAGDIDQVRICDAALAGNTAAWQECARVIMDAHAQYRAPHPSMPRPLPGSRPAARASRSAHAYQLYQLVYAKGLRCTDGRYTTGHVPGIIAGIILPCGVEYLVIEGDDIMASTSVQRSWLPECFIVPRVTEKTE